MLRQKDEKFLENGNPNSFSLMVVLSKLRKAEIFYIFFIMALFEKMSDLSMEIGGC